MRPITSEGKQETREPLTSSVFESCDCGGAEADTSQEPCPLPLVHLAVVPYPHCDRVRATEKPVAMEGDITTLSGQGKGSHRHQPGVACHCCWCCWCLASSTKAFPINMSNELQWREVWEFPVPESQECRH